MNFNTESFDYETHYVGLLEKIAEVGNAVQANFQHPKANYVVDMEQLVLDPTSDTLGCKLAEILGVQSYEIATEKNASEIIIGEEQQLAIEAASEELMAIYHEAAPKIEKYHTDFFSEED